MLTEPLERASRCASSSINGCCGLCMARLASWRLEACWGLLECMAALYHECWLPAHGLGLALHTRSCCTAVLLSGASVGVTPGSSAQVCAGRCSCVQATKWYSGYSQQGTFTCSMHGVAARNHVCISYCVRQTYKPPAIQTGKLNLASQLAQILQCQLLCCASRCSRLGQLC